MFTCFFCSLLHVFICSFVSLIYWSSGSLVLLFSCSLLHSAALLHRPSPLNFLAYLFFLSFLCVLISYLYFLIFLTLFEIFFVFLHLFFVVMILTMSNAFQCSQLFSQRFSTPPAMFVTASHQVPKGAHEAIVLWVENFSEESFTICIREAKMFNGPHNNIKIVSNF